MQVTAHPARTVLRTHDGVATLYLEQRQDQLILGWLLVGQVEPFGLLLEATIEWSDASGALSPTPPDTALTADLSARVRRDLATALGGARRVALGVRIGYQCAWNTFNAGHTRRLSVSADRVRPVGRRRKEAVP